MPAPHPRMHGITHVAGGPDPVPGLLPPLGDTLDEQILALAPAGFWKLNESSGSVAADSSGHGQDLSTGGALDPLWGFPAGPPGEQAADFTSAAGPSASRVSRSWPELTGDFTAAVWVNRTATNTTQVMGQGNPGRSGGRGWMLAVFNGHAEPETSRPYAVMYDGAGGLVVALNPLPTDTWAMLAISYDAAATEYRLYVNGLLEGSHSPTGYLPVASSSPLWVGHDGGLGSFDVIPASFAGSYAFLINRVLSGTEILNINETAVAGDTTTTGGGVVVPGGPGSVLGVDSAGNPAWVKPPVPAVTVNGSDQVAARTPKPTPPAPPPPDTDPAGVLIIDQPFTYGGSTFTVQPRRWTTIPFTTQLMERMSDKTGVSAWAEIPVGDPDAAGWLHADSPHVITVPHDMPFMAEAMGQICLRIDNPIVQGTSSHRALRIFETTHQKTLLQVDSELADGACAEGGMTDVFRGPGITVFASGDTASTGTHPDIFFLPNYGLAFYPTGYDWLPYIGGVQSLREGMRLVAQCWHDASVPLTFSCAPGTTYKPHFVLNVDCDPAWGPPWSTWY